ncbi:MAG: GNAT family N-acetyltransferase [Bacteroidota bacterium]
MSNYLLTTDRLYLRPFQLEDALGFYTLNADPAVLRYTGDTPFASVAAAAAFIRHYDHYAQYGYGRWAVLDQRDTQFIGFCGLKYHPDTDEVDLGYRLRREYWGQGMATEAARACLDYGLDELHLNRIIGRVVVGNLASVRVLEKIGMQRVGPLDFEGQPGWLYEARCFVKS